MAENIRRRIVLRAEQARVRALMWNMSYFDKIGGSGTLTSVWKRLKSEDKVRGRKRS